MMLDYRYPRTSNEETLYQQNYNDADILEISPLLVPKNEGTQDKYDVALLMESMETSLRAFFEDRAERWLRETQLHSSINSITRHPCFTQIKLMGPQVIVFVLERMSQGEVRVHWFPLLKDLSGEDPVEPHSRGRVREMADAWIDWGRAKGIIRD